METIVWQKTSINNNKASRIAYCVLLGVLCWGYWLSGQAAKSEVENADIKVGLTLEGYPYRGNPDAPIILEEYSDYLCPFCGRHFKNTFPALIEQYVKTGKVQYIYRDFPLASLHPTAEQGHAAALCAAEQGADLYWKMHDALFNQQRQWSRLQEPADFLAGLAEKADINRKKYDACMATERMKLTIEKSNAAGKALGFKGTPSFQFTKRQNGENYTLVGAQPLATFKQWLDALLAGNKPPEPEAPPKQELPFWAKPEGLAPDPDRRGWTTAGDPFKGNPQAKLVVIEYSDFQCESCARHVLETQPVIDKEFVESGKILWVNKHFPLKIHLHAAVAAVSAECAGEQRKFWEMHHLLFEKQDQWSSADADNGLVELAADLDLDGKAFSACFNGRKALERVLSDIYDGQGLIYSTPTFLLVHGGKGMVLKGARSAESFVKVLQKTYEVANKPDDKAAIAKAASAKKGNQ